jgi:hypothetical protein
LGAVLKPKLYLKCLTLTLDKLNDTMKEVTGKEGPLKKALLTGDTGYFSESNLQEAAKWVKYAIYCILL